MKTLSQSVQTSLEASVTRPIVLVEMGFSVTVRFCSGGDLRWNGQDWEGGRLAHGSVRLSPANAGGAQGALSLANHDNAISAIILSEGGSGKSVSIWYLYGTPPYATDEAIQVFEGVIDGVSGLGDVAKITILSAGMVQWTPRIQYTFDRFNHMTPPGTEISWGGEKYILESNRGH